MSQKWESEDYVTLDLRRLRPVLVELPQEMREVVVKNLRIAYPELLINLMLKGELRIEPK